MLKWAGPSNWAGPANAPSDAGGWPERKMRSPTTQLILPCCCASQTRCVPSGRAPKCYARSPGPVDVIEYSVGELLEREYGATDSGES